MSPAYRIIIEADAPELNFFTGYGRSGIPSLTFRMQEGNLDEARVEEAFQSLFRKVREAVHATERPA